MTNAHGGSSAWMLLGGLVAGLLAIATLVLAREIATKYVFIIFLGTVILIILPLVGNLRLFCLYCILMLAPLGARLSFLHHPHMGGAGALYIEALDPFMMLLLFFQVRDRVRGYRSTYRVPPALVLFACLIVLGIGSVVFQLLRTVAVLEVVRMLKVLLLALLVVNEMVRRKQFEHAIAALILGVLLQAVTALTQNMLGRQLGLQFLGEASDEDIKLLGETSLESGEFVYRAGGLLGHANFLAAYLALFLPTAVALILSPTRRYLRMLSLAALLVGPPALVLTLSRTGWIDFTAGLLLALALGILHPVSRRRFVAARVAIVAAIIVVGIALSPMIIKRLNQADPNSVKYRIEWIQTAKAMVFDNPLFGVGLNAYVYAQIPYGKHRTPGEMTSFYGEIWPVVHNSWMIVWSEQGTIGFLVWVAFHLSVISTAVGNLRIRDPMMHALNVGLLAGFVGIMIDGLASFYVKQESTSRTFWIATALILAIRYWRLANEQGAAAPAPPPVSTATPQQPDAAPSGGRWLPARMSPLR